MSEVNNGDYPSFAAQDVEIIDKSTVFQGFFQIERCQLRHKLYAGGWSSPMVREIFERGHAAAVLPYNPQTDELVLIEQFRPGAMIENRSPWLLETIAGMIDHNQTGEQTARREALEEAGLELGKLWPMLSYFSSPGGSTERVQLFLGQLTGPVVPGIYGLEQEHEDIKVQLLPRVDAMHLLAEGKIDNAATVIALQWLTLHLTEVRRAWSSDAVD
ncbi:MULTISPECIES: NUDIX domain-containing protein [unclassified Arsukibacterium]|uniref:NUDIX domain-containing protein n=1 Tax=unclassified Arsukibacterium TaxID=2635278 RepID=UPI000C3A39F4|nr:MULTISPECIES: NUDIX domain-containing protein [unclassified Arsukibacterium]MAA94697.1 ADP-ribose diphosphatase [Rheinheimera sp.]MBM33752.1 ADP-ribose diphosphatase [Rheinheimera sp.]HAW91468.1 ADP-ribose diphosphatase [Candidatus Azambacteria bacterium]|tara:strand:+ start:22556 stop:23203 length:648 start_codon:yes stop_codon:yes gene_type:complete